MTPRTIRPVHIPWGPNGEYHEAVMDHKSQMYVWLSNQWRYSDGLTVYTRISRLKWFPVAVEG